VERGEERGEIKIHPINWLSSAQLSSTK